MLPIDATTTLFTLATLCSLLLAVFYCQAKYRQTYWSRRGVYSPPAHWLFGHFRDAVLLRESPQEVFARWHLMFQGHPDKPVIGLYIMQKPFLLLRSPEVMKHVYVKSFSTFPNHYFATKRRTDVIGSAGLFSIDNPDWRYLRTRLSPAFASGRIKALLGLMLEKAGTMRDHLAARVQAEGEGGERIGLDVETIANKYATDVISSFSLGIRTNSFDEGSGEVFYKRTRMTFNQGLKNTGKIFLNFFFPQINDLFGSTFLGENTDFFRQIFWDSMNEREQSGVKRGDIIDALLDLKNNQQSSEFEFQGDRLAAQSAIFFVAGLGTSSVTISFALLELARHPEIQKKARDEIREKIGKGPITYELVNEMTYLQQVMNETLRLYPPAPLVDRFALADYKIPDTDIVIEKGTPVLTTLNGIHKDPDYHTDPLSFDPDRFSEARQRDMKPMTFFPFGEGPRACIGMRVGKLQTLIGLITILSEYELTLNSNYKNEISRRAIFTAPANGIHLYLQKSPI